MEYITVKAASVKWGINPRQIQYLCQTGRVGGAFYFNRSWAIPCDAAKPTAAPSKTNDARPPGGSAAKSFLLENVSHLGQIIEDFPCSINITAADGTMVYANQAFLAGTLPEAQNELGKYNILQEPMLEKWGLKEHTARAFRGERVVTAGLELPNRELVGDKFRMDYAFISIFQDITSFPIFDEKGGLLYVVTVFIPVRKTFGREEVHRARNYIEEHWREPYEAKAVAAAANLGVSRINRLFKEDTGFSPHDYYIDLKISHLQKNLADANISVAKAFAECGLDYNSYYVSMFKRKTGMTPSQFRRRNRHS